MSVCVMRCFPAQDLIFVVRLEVEMEGGGGGGWAGILVWFRDLAFVRGGVVGRRYWLCVRFRISLVVRVLCGCGKMAIRGRL